jgi:redox-sensitive bicupin YhaK (pirin superfamily)
MNRQPKAKIFLADKRGCNETDWFRSYSTFNFGYFNEHKYPFGDLYVLNDDAIAGGHSINLTVEENSCILLLPVVGTVLCRVNQCIESIVNAGQLKVFQLHQGDSIELLNCYENELINFIQVWIKADDIESSGTNQLFTFHLDENKNVLIKITKSTAVEEKNPGVSIGKFAGRNEGVYKLKNKQNNLFVFVIEGVFEVQGRLLHARDGLGLWNESEEIGLEALSNDGIVLIIEMSNA